MGIYIKGMKMPTGCAFCKIKKRNGGKMVCPLCNEEWDIHDPMSADFRLESCPLVPVPPHGRLIDADALKASLAFAEKTADWAVPALRAVLMVIDEMPTIIPAEEGET